MIHKIIGGGVGMTIEGAIKLAREEVAPIDDIRSTGSYRRHVAGVMLKRFLINA
jgi:CO/xanthine dehydrogenase FAD-binding subunit